MTQYIEMIVSYNDYHKTEYRRKFYIQPRSVLNNGNYEPCHTEYNSKYSDEYDFYHAIEENGGFTYIAVPKPYYRIITPYTVIEVNCNDYFKVFQSANHLQYEELMAEELQEGNYIEVEEYEPPQEIPYIEVY